MLISILAGVCLWILTPFSLIGHNLFDVNIMFETLGPNVEITPAGDELGSYTPSMVRHQINPLGLRLAITETGTETKESPTAGTKFGNFNRG